VQRGDTLYSIAFRYGLEYRGLGAANGIAAPYTIFPGQKIHLKEATPPQRAAIKPAPAAKTSTVARSAPAATGSANSQPAKTSTPVTRPSSSATNTTPPTSRNAPWEGVAVKAWRWPASGKVTRGYSSTVHKGIDIGGQRGDDINAVAAGKVVYAGTGIVGFGQLLIVKHNELYLSAYGHNNRLLVVEGDQVRAGQKIAEKGSSGTDKVKLHFEIRKEGKPINPQRLLPRR
jgi:lipoprotein NlpD